MPGRNGAMKVVDWVSWDSREDDCCITEKQGYTDEHNEALKEEIIRLGLRKTGWGHQMDKDGVPVFEDGKVIMHSMRSWGGLMAEIWSEEGNEYTYMDFYMGHPDFSEGPE